MSGEFPIFNPFKTIFLRDIPYLEKNKFIETISACLKAGSRIMAFFGAKVSGEVQLFIVLALKEKGKIAIFSAMPGESFVSLTSEFPEAEKFERAIYETWNIRPEGHPRLRPLRFEKLSEKPGVSDFYRVEGSEIHEVAVGPVHAGIIEPGHFRFQCYGEEVLHLEIALGYQHRGIAKKIIGGPSVRTIHYMETLAGDTTSGHALAYALLFEALSGTRVSSKADKIRAISLELERLANHAGDLGALAGDAAYLPTASFSGRLRGDFLNLTALITGSRFGRGGIVPGGVGFDVNQALGQEILKKLKPISSDLKNAIGLLWSTPSVMDRFEKTGTLSKSIAEKLGVTGVAARASGLGRDARIDFPSGAYHDSGIRACVENSGDVLARARVRWRECEESISFLNRSLPTAANGEFFAKPGPLAANALALSVVEGWRGEITHVGLTGADGKFIHYEIVDPSIKNWSALEQVMRGGEIFDFPLCNKSFSLSYCGNDL